MEVKPTLHELTGNVVDFLNKRRRILRSVDALSKTETKHPTGGESPLPAPDAMERYLDQELTRRRTIEDKAKTNALAITLAFSAMLAVVAFVRNLADANNGLLAYLFWFVIGFQIIGMGFLLMGGWLALGALRAVPTQMWTLADDKRNLSEGEKSLEMSGFLDFNQHYTNLKSNHLETSYSCIRNGVIAFFGAALLGLILALISEYFISC